MSAPGTPLTPTQLRVFDELLAIGGTRPVAPAGLADELARHITEGTAAALANWKESNMWLSKAGVGSIRRCEGQVVADSSQPRRRGLHRATAIGIVVHRAIQLAYTHPDRTPDQHVRAALAGSRSEEAFGEFWDDADDATQSDVIVESVNRLCGFLDSFPPLEAIWVPRFEDSTVARLRRLVLAAKADLTLGRPRGDGRQTMFLADFKSGELRDNHFEEAMFYALVSTLRHGCPPFRSCVVSLSSGEWTDPDVTPARLAAAADAVVGAVNARVEVLLELRAPTLSPGMHCSWCPAKATCAGSAAWEQAGRPMEHAITLVGSPLPVGASDTTAQLTLDVAPAEVAPPATPATALLGQAVDAPGDSGPNPWLVD